MRPARTAPLEACSVRGYGGAMATHSALYKAPFGPGGASEVDVQLAEKLLAVALSRGADYADIFFEYRAAGGFVYDENILKSASRGVSMGLGVRAQQGDATGYAYTERLDWDAMKRAAETAPRSHPAAGRPSPSRSRFARSRAATSSTR